MKIDSSIKVKQQKKKHFFCLLLYVLFSSSQSAQIYTKDCASLTISEGAFISQKEVNQESEKSHIFIVKGTTTFNLKSSSSIKITYIDSRIKKGKYLSEKNTKIVQKIKKSVKQEINKENRLCLKNKNEDEAFFSKLKNRSVIIISSSNNIKFTKLADFFFKINILYREKSEIKIINYSILKRKNNFSFSIRPPPYL